jgi:signal transduction histidine kinase
MVSVSSVEDTMRHMAFFPKKRWIKVAVQDHGIGIPRDEQKKVFRRFYRVKGTADSNVSGVGLGLALCRHVAVQHGGWIEVESEVGKGSTFSVFLPVAGKG